MLDACGRLRHLLLVWQTSVPAILLMPKDMQGVLPCSFGMVNVGAHNTVDVQRHVGGALPRLSGMGVDGAHTLYGKCRRPQHCLGSDMLGRVQGTLLTCPVGTVLQVYRVRSSVLWLT